VLAVVIFSPSFYVFAFIHLFNLVCAVNESCAKLNFEMISLESCKDSFHIWHVVTSSVDCNLPAFERS